MFMYIMVQQRVLGGAAGPGWAATIIKLKFLAPFLLAVSRLSTAAVKVARRQEQHFVAQG